MLFTDRVLHRSYFDERMTSICRHWSLTQGDMLRGLHTWFVQLSISILSSNTFVTGSNESITSHMLSTSLCSQASPLSPRPLLKLMSSSSPFSTSRVTCCAGLMREEEEVTKPHACTLHTRASHIMLLASTECRVHICFPLDSRTKNNICKSTFSRSFGSQLLSSVRLDTGGDDGRNEMKAINQIYLLVFLLSNNVCDRNSPLRWYTPIHQASHTS